MLRFVLRVCCLALVSLVMPAVALAAHPHAASKRGHVAPRQRPQRRRAKRTPSDHAAVAAAAVKRRARKPAKPSRPAPVRTSGTSNASAGAPLSAAPAPSTSAPATTTPAPVTSAPPAAPTPAGDTAENMPEVTSAPVPVISGRTFYVSASGSDANSGTSPSQAWRTVGRVNEQVLAPGDGVLFEGGQTFGDADLQPASSGTAGAPIVYGSYGQGDATIALGAWFVQSHLVFDHLQFGATFYGGSEVHGASDSVTVQNCVFAPAPGNQGLGIYTNGDDWTIADNTVRNTGLSGMLLNGDGYQVTGNTISAVGLYDAGYNAHGIYLDASNATITDNTITDFSESAVSARYRNSTIERNYFNGGQIGIDFYQTDPSAGTSHWLNNTIANTTSAGIYVSSDGDYPLHESFVVRDNSILPRSGVLTNFRADTRGTYSVADNTRL